MENLRKMRNKQGLSQQRLADMVGVSRPTVVFWEQGKNMPHIKYLNSLAKALKCKVSDILPKE